MGLAGEAVVVVEVEPGEGFVAVEDQQVLGVGVLGGFGEVEAAGDEGSPVQDHDLVMGDGVAPVNPDRDAGVGEKGRRGIPGGGVAFVQERLDVDTAFMGVDQGLGDGGDGGAGEAVRLDDDLRLGAPDLPHDGFGGAAWWGEEGLDRAR